MSVTDGTYLSKPVYASKRVVTVYVFCLRSDLFGSFNRRNQIPCAGLWRVCPLPSSRASTLDDHSL
jgi:hypothetical protein